VVNQRESNTFHVSSAQLTPDGTASLLILKAPVTQLNVWLWDVAVRSLLL